MPNAPLPHDHNQPIEWAPERIPSVDDFQTVADIFKQLGDGSRIPSSGCSATARSASSTFRRW